MKRITRLSVTTDDGQEHAWEGVGAMVVHETLTARESGPPSPTRYVTATLDLSTAEVPAAEVSG